MRRAAVVVVLAACAPPVQPTDAGVDPPPVDDAGRRDVIEESEPNDGADGQPPDELLVDAEARGAIGAPGDADVYAVATQPGRVYRVVATPLDGSPVDLRVTVLDAGRDGDAAGSDYVRIARAPAGPSAELEFVASGFGGHLVVVRAVAAVGGADHRYAVQVLPLGRADVDGAELRLGDAQQGALRHGGAVAVHALAVGDGASVIVDVRASVDADLRIHVHSDAVNAWIARNDDRAAGDLDPLIDAPLTEDGPYLLVVENVDEDAEGLVPYAVTID